jgi:transcriptional regulator with XRE-family HTH domain
MSRIRRAIKKRIDQLCDRAETKYPAVRLPLSSSYRITQKKIAAACGISAGQLSRYLCGQCDLSGKRLECLLSLLGFRFYCDERDSCFCCFSPPWRMPSTSYKPPWLILHHRTVESVYEHIRRRARKALK